MITALQSPSLRPSPGLSPDCRAQVGPPGLLGVLKTAVATDEVFANELLGSYNPKTKQALVVKPDDVLAVYKPTEPPKVWAEDELAKGKPAENAKGGDLGFVVSPGCGRLTPVKDSLMVPSDAIFITVKDAEPDDSVTPIGKSALEYILQKSAAQVILEDVGNYSQDEKQYRTGVHYEKYACTEKQHLNTSGAAGSDSVSTNLPIQNSPTSRPENASESADGTGDAGSHRGPIFVLKTASAGVCDPVSTNLPIQKTAYSVMPEIPGLPPGGSDPNRGVNTAPNAEILTRGSSQANRMTSEEMLNDVRQHVMSAAETGQKEVFDSAGLGALLQTEDPQGLMQSYISDIQKNGLDRVGRLLLLYYWKNDEFRDEYGEEKMKEIGDKLKGAFKTMAKLLVLLRSRSPDDTYIRSADSGNRFSDM